MYHVEYTHRFKKDLKRCASRGLNLKKLYQPDWLLVWEQNDEKFTLLFVQTGTHSDLF